VRVGWVGAQAAEDLLGCDYEILSAFVSSAADLQRLIAAASAIATGWLEPRGNACGAMYFLWPAAYGEAIDASDGSLQLGGGFVEASSMLGLMRAMERIGVPSRFPHPATLYETLASKSWQPSFCMNGSLQVPPTTAVPVALIRKEPARAAGLALESLALLQQQQQQQQQVSAAAASAEEAAAAGRRGAASASESAPSCTSVSTKWADVAKAAAGACSGGPSMQQQAAAAAALGQSVSVGSSDRRESDDAAVVVKLGFSWEALDVTKVQVPPITPCVQQPQQQQCSASTGRAAAAAAVSGSSSGGSSALRPISPLAHALTAAISSPGCRNDCVLVQRFVSCACCELRLFVVDGVVRGRYLARYEDTTPEGKFQNWLRLERAEAAKQWFDGDAAALASAEADAESLVPRLLTALRGLCTEPIPAVRLDFLLERRWRCSESEGRKLNADADAEGSAEGSGAERWTGRASTLEITEAGFSMWGWPQGPALVFEALVRACLLPCEEQQEQGHEELEREPEREQRLAETNARAGAKRPRGGRQLQGGGGDADAPAARRGGSITGWLESSRDR
jgi:hypothetical protein